MALGLKRMFADGSKDDKRKAAEDASAKAREYGRKAEEARRAGRLEEAQHYMDLAEDAGADAYRKRRAAGEDYAEGGRVGKAKRLLSGRKRQIEEAIEGATQGGKTEKPEKPKKYAKGGKVCRGSGAATRGTKFKGVF